MELYITILIIQEARITITNAGGESEKSSVQGENPPGDVLQDPIHALQEVVPCHCAAGHDLPVMCLDLLQLQHVPDLLRTQGARQVLSRYKRLITNN